MELKIPSLPSIIKVLSASEAAFKRKFGKSFGLGQFFAVTRIEAKDAAEKARK
ncbi:hypothetical protein [Treponema sp.]|uniref:hypothetical protein n=1 Tax=Treponema sp. TaxID=166 RepID=UPI0025E43DF3|nr:hypothetical protein [Treponema sp.]MBR4322549.1 hypothetical protein [Treponema sp.]